MRRLTRFVLAGTVVVIGVIWIISWALTATITISSDPQATIYVKQGENDFTEVGKGTASYSTRSTDTLYIETRHKNRSTQKVVEPVRRENLKIELALRPVVNAEAVAGGPLVHPFITDKFVYGVNPETNNIDAQRYLGDSVPSPVLPLLPYLDKILWFDSSRYIYVTLGEGTGVVTPNGQYEGEVYNFIDAAMVNSNSIGLVGSDGLFLADGISIDSARKLSPLHINSSPAVFADKQNLYFPSLIYAEQTDEGEPPVGLETKLEVYQASGDKLHDVTLPITGKTYNVAEVKESTFAVLHEQGLLFWDTSSGQLSPVTFSFGEVRDILMYKERLLLLGDAGLWQYDVGLDEYYKLASYPEGELYVPNSLTVYKGALYFSTQVSDDELLKSETSAQSSIYRISL